MDATILEVGVGGLLDCTNVVPKPIVTGVTALGYDHVAVLGKTLREIAFQKGGIYKVIRLINRSLCLLADLLASLACLLSAFLSHQKLWKVSKSKRLIVRCVTCPFKKQHC